MIQYGAEAELVWFTAVIQRSGIQVYQPGQGNVSLAERTRETGTEGRLSRLSHGRWLDSLFAWHNNAVNGLSRIGFRLHPLSSDFQHLRRLLLNRPGVGWQRPDEEGHIIVNEGNVCFSVNGGDDGNAANLLI